ncbi:MAG: L-threonylcarbamoyladenylate synthase [Patescibacteria group bacterium]
MVFRGFTKKAAEILRRGGIGVVPTDTIYGISASAFNSKAVMRVYRLRQRDLKKPMIVLIGSVADLKKFDVHLLPTTYHLLTRFWPGKVSIVLPCAAKKFFYLHRGTNSLAFRLPAYPALRKLLAQTGPLISTSANPADKPSAKTIAEAKRYFGNEVDFYVDIGRQDSPPSTLIAVRGGKMKVLREGAVKVRI